MEKVSDYFGCMVFDDRVMKANLSAEVYQSLRKTIGEGQRAGQLRAGCTVNDIVKAYALWERALLYDWCLCGGEYSLSAYTDTVTPRFLEGYRAVV